MSNQYQNFGQIGQQTEIKAYGNISTLLIYFIHATTISRQRSTREVIIVSDRYEKSRCNIG